MRAASARAVDAVHCAAAVTPGAGAAALREHGIGAWCACARGAECVCVCVCARTRVHARTLTGVMPLTACARSGDALNELVLRVCGHVGAPTAVHEHRVGESRG